MILTNPLDSKLPSDFQHFSPLLIPLIFSKYYGNWIRVKRDAVASVGEVTVKKQVHYTYNGKVIKNFQELRPCIKECNQQVYDLFYSVQSDQELIPMLTVENFCFDESVDTNAYHDPDLVFEKVSDDVSKGTEAVKIPAYAHKSYPDKHKNPPSLIYINTVDPSDACFEHCKLSLSKDKMLCCTCTDGCVDRTKCECALRTKEIFDNSSKKWARNIRSDNTNSATPLGYKNRKLLESSDDAMAHRIGLFECSPECTCMNQMKYNNPCENRVVQCGIRQVLYLELMPIKGWGVRTRYDIPKGTFISTY